MRRTVQAAAAVAAVYVALASCAGDPVEPTHERVSRADGPVDGGTLRFLTSQPGFRHLDPQRNYTGEDVAFAGGYLQRTLTAYRYGPGEQATELVGDLATDTGRASKSATRWTFTLKDGVAFEDGTPITCDDVKYGVSRTFATDVITEGPQYAVTMLDIPRADDGSSVYKGPYVRKNNDGAAFDKAVRCPDEQTIVFHLAEPVGDFNHTVTLLAFSPVPQASDTGAEYTDAPVSSGPYRIAEYSKGRRMVLERNPAWTRASDGYRGAHPDRIVVSFGLEAAAVDQRLVADSGRDQAALTLGDPVAPASLAAVFGEDRFADRRTDELDPFVRYLAVNTRKVPVLEHRRAIAVALDRAQERTIAGGEFAGDLADGVVKPNLAKDYAPSGMWTGLLGRPVPDGGDPAAARGIIAASGKAMPTLVYDYPQSPVNDSTAAAVVGSLAKAGITVRPNAVPADEFYGHVLDPAKEGHLVWSGWGPDWANASTVIPELFTPSGGYDLSHADDEKFVAKVAKAKAMTDRAAQAELWKQLNREAMAKVWAIPLRFGRDHRLAGSAVGAAAGTKKRVYLWAPFGSWPYGDLFVAR